MTILAQDVVAIGDLVSFHVCVLSFPLQLLTAIGGSSRRYSYAAETFPAIWWRWFEWRSVRASGFVLNIFLFSSKLAR